MPTTGLPHAIRSPPVVYRTPYAPVDLLARNRAVNASISALTAATSSASTSVRIVASTRSLTDSASGW